MSAKGGKHHEVPAHHNAEVYIDAWLLAAGIGGESGTPFFRSFRGRSGEITEVGVTRTDVFRMVKHRARLAKLSATTCSHTFRATGITAYMSNGGTIEKAQAIVAHLAQQNSTTEPKMKSRSMRWRGFSFEISFCGPSVGERTGPENLQEAGCKFVLIPKIV